VKTETKATKDLMLKEYSCYELSSANRFNDLLSKLKKVNLYNPQKRAANEMDDWFKKVTPQLMHDGSCLAYINNYGYLEDSFWVNIANLGLKPEQDKEFQQILFSVRKTSCGYWMPNFRNLSFNYGKRYKLLPEIEHIVNTDSCFTTLKETYEFARKVAEKDKLKAI